MRDRKALFEEHGRLANRMFAGPKLTGADRKRLMRIRRRLERDLAKSIAFDRLGRLATAMEEATALVGELTAELNK